MHSATQTANPVWSLPVAVNDVPAHGLDLTVSADAQTREALRAFLGLPGLARADAAFHIARRGREGLRVTGEVRATVTQTCVVSLEPFEADIVEKIDTDFAPPQAADARRPEGIEEEAAMEEADPIVNGRVDLGALAAEHLALGLDPYPRKPGATFKTSAAVEKTSPFAALESLANKAGRRER
ncbi:MAG: DUF177 domain-containing protein [Hyphomicrobiales bacterium]|nr:DUF177 domain-containing protein [Hyphomicrobiales bacterium]